MSIQVEGRDNLGFLDPDYRNYMHSKQKNKMKKGDASAILQYIQKCTRITPHIFMQQISKV